MGNLHAENDKNVCTNALQNSWFLVYNRLMRNYIRKVKSKSGATAVQIEHKRGRERIGITHIGSAHNEAELKVLLEIAHSPPVVWQFPRILCQSCPILPGR